MCVLQRWNKNKFTRCRLTTEMKTTSDVHTGITTAALVKVSPTPVTTIPDTSNRTAASLPRSPKHVGNTKKMADRHVTIVDTLQRTLLVQHEVRSVETSIRRTTLLEYATPSRWDWLALPILQYPLLRRVTSLYSWLYLPRRQRHLKSPLS